MEITEKQGLTLTHEYWGIKENEGLPEIREEHEALEYLLSCRMGFAYDKDLVRPPIEVLNRALNRNLIALEKCHKCHQYNVNKHPSKNIRKQYKATRHYLFKLTCEAWVDKLPPLIQTLENRYKNFDKGELPIPEN